MAAIKLFLDEDVHVFIAEALRLRSREVLTTAEAERRGSSDEEQLRFAAAGGYTLLTYNVRHFAPLHYVWMEREETHSGIILARQSDGRHNVRPLLRLLGQVTAEQIRNQLVYLRNWG